jgi:hypothetical protein
MTQYNTELALKCLNHIVCEDKRDQDCINTAISALREQAQREKGCEYCDIAKCNQRNVENNKKRTLQEATEDA